MSNYLPNSPDYIPQLQNFNPNLNFYADVLATKQSQYNQGLDKISSIYSSAFNSPMLREDNLTRRDKYFKTIEQQIQKVAGMDLSIDQNVSSAKALFDPLLNDQHIIKDITYTKGLQNSYQRAEQFRNCVDETKCGGSYWDEGVQALQYAQEEFQKASPDDSLKYSAPEYVPFQNVTQKAMKAAKDSGFNISYDHKSADGRYIVTDTNGQLLLGPDGEGILPQYLYGLFGNDSSVQKMYSTQAYVQRKNYAKANAGKFNGSEDMAESEYLHNIMMQTVPVIEKAKNDLTDLRNKVNVDSKALEILHKSDPTNDVQDAYAQLQNILATTEPTAAYHQQVSNLITTAPNLNDIKSLRSRVDNVVANANFIGAIKSAAYDYAMGTAKHEEKADPYALAAFNSSLDLGKAKQLKNYDHQIWLQQQSLLGNIDSVDQYGNTIPGKNSQLSSQRQAVEALIKNNISKEELLKMGITRLDKPALAKLAKSGLLNKENTDVVSNFALTSTEAEPFQNTYNENSKVVNAALDQALGNSKIFVKDMLSSMINSYKNADATQGKDAVGIKAKILVDTKAILQGTGIDYNALIRGEVPLDNLNDKVNVQMANTALKLRTSSVSSRVYSDGYDDATLAKLQVANQAAEGLYKQRNLDLKNAVTTTLADKITLANNGELSPEEYQKQQALYTSFINPNGGMVTPQEAKARYVKATHVLYGGINNVQPKSAEEDNYITNANNKAYSAAAAAFDSNYVPALKTINSKLTSFASKPLSRDAGGMEAVGNAVEKRFNGNQPLDPNTQYVKNIILDLAKNKDNQPIAYSGTGAGLISSQNVETTPDKQDLFSKVVDKMKSGDTKDLNITTQIQYVPKTFDQFAFSFDSSVDKAVYTDPNNPKAFPGTFTNDAVMVKMVVGEDDYRKLYGIPKKDAVSESDRSFVIKTTPNFESLSPFVQGIQKSPQELYMQKTGNSLSFDLGQKGTALVERATDGNLYVKANVPQFDTESGQWGEPIKVSYQVPEQKLENAYPVITNKLNEAYSINQAILTDYYKHARSSK